MGALFVNEPVFFHQLLPIIHSSAFIQKLRPLSKIQFAFSRNELALEIASFCNQRKF